MIQESQNQITASQVEDYLRKHPDYFQQHLDLLEIMYIPHPTGAAISLISKQLEILRNKHQVQENQLTALIDIARDNDASINRMHELTLAMLEANSLEDAVANLSDVLASSFFTDFVAIKIIKDQTDYVISQLFVAPDDSGLTHFTNEIRTKQPKCGRPTYAQARFLFGEAATEVRSCAIIPMVFNGLEGLIAIGSRDDARFHYSMGSLFLTQMSEIIGTRLISLLDKPE